VERWTRIVLRFRWLVLAAWLVVLTLGAWSSTRLSPLLSNSFAVPGTDSERARAILQHSFGERPDGTFTVVFVEGKTGQARAAARLKEAAKVVSTGHAGQVRAGDGVIYGDITTTLDLKHAKRWTEKLRKTLRAQRGPPALVTGQPAIQHDLDGVFRADVSRGEAFALPVALVVLFAVFGLSFAAAVPFVFAACTITGTLGAVFLVAHHFSMVTYVTNLVELIGLGLAIDYSLLVVYRYREELAAGRSGDDAIVRTMTTAGRAVVFSGLAVAIGLGLLCFMPVPFIRSMGVAGFLIPLVSIAGCLTLQPAMLSLLGPRGMRRARVWRPKRSFWAPLAHWIMRRPLIVLMLAGGLLVAAAVPAAFLRVTPGSITGFPASLESAKGFSLLSDRVGPGVITPSHLIVDSGAPGRVRTMRKDVERLVDRIAEDGETYVVASGTALPYVDRTGRYSRVYVIGRHEYGDPESRRFVDRLRDRAVPAAHLPAGVHVYAGGAPPQGVDFLDRSYGAFPWLIAGVLLLTYLVLLRAFRSVLLPLKAVLLNLLSVAAVYGILVVVFEWGVGADLFGLYHRPEIEGWIPIFLFAALFGLSMDYEVFLVSRMREVWDATHDNPRAVAEGLEKTGQIVTAAAVIMCAAFLGFVIGRVAALQEFGLGLAFGVLIDATIIRTLLVPALMAVLGRWNWWLPRAGHRR
jgi:putative drug exporter of the RND superfamily